MLRGLTAPVIERLKNTLQIQQPVRHIICPNM
jgi:hypothetical protein